MPHGPRGKKAGEKGMNRLVKTLIYNNEMSLCVMDTTELVNEAIEIHRLSPLSAAALGRVLTVSSFMASCLKNETDKLSVSVVGDGVGGTITVSGNSALDMRVRNCLFAPTASWMWADVSAETDVSRW